jgi:hypothetical protein
VRLIRKVNNFLDVLTFTLDPNTKRVVPNSANNVTADESHSINDMDFTKYLIASATGEGGVKFRI